MRAADRGHEPRLAQLGDQVLEVGQRQPLRLGDGAERDRGGAGLAVLSTIATSHINDLLASGTDAPDALTEGYQTAFLGGAAIAALGFVLTLVLISNRDSKAHVEIGKEEARQRGEEATEVASA